MNTNILLLAISVLPVVVLAWVVYRRDRVEKEPIGMLVKAFFFGGLSIIPAIILEFILEIPGMLFSNMPIISGLYDGFVVAAFSEELCKMAFLFLAVWKSRHFNEYFDGIVYAAFVSLGFACFENIEYVFFQDSFIDSLSTGFMRALLSVPGHFLFGVVMGYYFSLAKFQPWQRTRNLLLAFLVPIFLHGTFDALLMISNGFSETFPILTALIYNLFLGFDIFLWIIGVRRLKHLQLLSDQQNRDGNFGNPDVRNNYDAYNNNPNGNTNDPNTPRPPENPFSGFKWDV
ncbi:MAG: PrsW family intramembrane metalloprotease [Bacteroidales bacterium]|nr:PrsW family intramembrane metalloprotease [Bacteroidales bacterium]